MLINCKGGIITMGIINTLIAIGTILEVVDCIFNITDDDN